MKTLSLLLFLFLFQTVNAQSVTALMRDASFKTDVPLPFRLTNAQSMAQNIFDVRLVAGGSSCQVLVDPFIRSNFLLKCASASSVQVSVYFYLNGEYKKINYGPFNVGRLTDAPVSQPGGGVDPYASGKQAFQNACLQCHLATDKANRSVAKIKAAISSQPQMRSIVLTNEQVQAISDYLGHL